MTTERIDIIVRERGSSIVKRNIQSIGNTAVDATRGLRLLQNSLFVLGGAGLLRGLVNNIDTLNNFKNRLRLVTDSTAELNKVQQELFDISVRTRTAFATTATVFTRTAFNTKELGLSMKETLGFTEALNKAVLISGANAREAEAATIQLSQAIASDRFSGDELRSVLEQLPFAADVIAKGVNATRGELREMGKDGQITAEKIIDAFLKATKEIDGLFGSLNITVSQSLDIFNTKFLEFLSIFDQTTGFSDSLVSAIVLIGTNLDSIIPIALGVASVIAVRFLGPLIGGLGEAAKAQFLLTRSVMRGEVAFAGSAKAILIQSKAELQLAAAELKIVAATQARIKTQVANNNLTAASTRLMISENSVRIQTQRGIVASGGSTAVLNKLLATESAQRQILTQTLRVNAAAKAELVGVNAAVARSQAVVSVTTAAQTAAMARATIGARVLSGALALLKGALTLVGGIGGLILLAATSWLIFGTSADTATTANKQQEESLNALNRELRENLTLTEKAASAKKLSAEATLLNLRDQEMAAASSILFFDQQIRDKKEELLKLQNSARGTGSRGGPNVTLDELIEIQDKIKQIDNLKDALKEARVDFDKFEAQADSLSEGVDRFSSNLAQKRNRTLEKLEASLNPIEAAALKLRNFEEKLNSTITSKKTGKSEEEVLELRAKLLSRQTFLLKEALDPLGFLNEKLDFENSLLGKSNTERGILNKARTETLRLQKAGVDTTGEEVEASIRLNEAISKQISMLDSIRGARDNFNEGSAALTALLQSGEITVREYTTTLRKLKILDLEEGTTFGEGLARGLLKVEEKFEDVASVAEDLVVNSFTNAEDALVKFVTTGKLSFKSLIDSMIADLARLAIRQAVGSIFGKIFGAATSLITGNISGVVGGTSMVPDFSNAIKNPIPGFATGGSFNVGGSGGTDSQLVSFRASPNERVTIQTPQQQKNKGGVTNVFHIDARGADVGVEEKIIQGIKAATPLIVNAAREGAMGDTVELLSRRTL